MKTAPLVLAAALLAIALAPTVAATSACTPGTFAFINPMPRACVSATLDAVCVTLRTESTTTECVPLP